MLALLALSLGLGEEIAIPATTGLKAYRIDRTEVSIEAYESFENNGGYQREELWSPEGLAWLATQPNGAGQDLRRSERPPTHPVVAVSFYEAEAYCRWRGGSLPSAEQWTQAICSEAAFPWGSDTQRPAAWYAGGKYGQVQGVNTQEAHIEAPSLTGPHGVLHGAGNVWEWTQEALGLRAEWRALRGGSYANLPSYSQCAHREPAQPQEQRLTAGFRCVYP